jgi:hypothetical protein
MKKHRNRNPPLKNLSLFSKVNSSIVVKFIKFTLFFQKTEEKVVDLFSNKFGFDDNADPFANGNFTKTNGNDGNNNGDFDPFGAPPSFDTKKDTSSFGFDESFANFDGFNDSEATNEGAKEKLDAWGTSSLDKTNNNNTSLGKVKKYNDKDVNKLTKFTGDYSDNFEDDLAQVLKRSVVDQ